MATYQNPDGPDGSTANDGKEFVRSEIVAKGSSAPNLNGKFHDKTAIEADRTGGSCDGNVYFAWSRFTNGGSNIYFSRSTDHGATWSQPQSLTSSVNDVQVPEVTVTGNGHATSPGSPRSGTEDRDRRGAVRQEHQLRWQLRPGEHGCHVRGLRPPGRRGS